MTFGRRVTDFPNQQLVTGVFYYLALLILIGSLCTALYWQLESDDIELGFVDFEHHSTPQTRAFLVPVDFCSQRLTEFTVIRSYHDTDRNIWYAVPDGRYKTGASGCFDTRIQAHTGRLDPGNYEYHVSVSYGLNPLRTEQHKVAIVRLVIE
jgi:hypothetical protein